MVTLQGTPALAQRREELRIKRARVADFPALHRRMGDALVGWAQRNFAAEGALLDEFPSGWPALAPATVAGRRRRGRGLAILQDTGRLAHGTIVFPDADRALVDNSAPYAARHQLGLGVPRRPVLPEAPQARRLALGAAQEHVTEALR